MIVPLAGTSANQVVPILCTKLCNICLYWNDYPIYTICAICTIFVHNTEDIICTAVLHSSIAQQYCTSYCISLCAIWFNFIAQVLIWLNLLHILYILGNRSNYCTLLHTIVHNKIDQYCCCVLFSPPASCLLACDCSTVHTATDSLLSMLFRSDLTFKSRITRIYCAPPAAAGAGAGAAARAAAGPPPSLSDPDSRRLTRHDGTLDLRRSPVIPCWC